MIDVYTELRGWNRIKLGSELFPKIEVRWTPDSIIVVSQYRLSYVTHVDISLRGLEYVLVQQERCYVLCFLLVRPYEWTTLVVVRM